MPVLRMFLVTVGVDAELCFMRTLGYMLAKWLILNEMRVGLQTLTYTSSELRVLLHYGGSWVLGVEGLLAGDGDETNTLQLPEYSVSCY
jgi:hypothetical protein